MNQRTTMQRYGKRAAVGLLMAGGLFFSARAQTEWQDVLKYDFGTSDGALTNIENQVLLATPAQRPALEKKLLGVLAASDATFPAKQYACRMLKIIGSDKSVPALAKLLSDEKLSHAARIALEALPGEAAGAALRDALGKAKGKLQIGIIGSLGARRDGKAVKALAALLDNKDAAPVCASLKALARIGDLAAAKALEQAQVGDSLRTEWCDDCLACANNLIAAQEAKRALQLIQLAVKNEHCPHTVRVGAFLTVVRLDQAGGAKLILDALNTDDPILQQAVVPAVGQLTDAKQLQIIVKALPELSIEKQVALMPALVAHPDTPNMSAQINAWLAGTNVELKTAAIAAVVRLGDAQNVKQLVADLEANDDLSKLAQQTLIDLQGKQVVKELLKSAQTGDPKLRVSVIAILAERRDVKVLPALYALLDDANSKVRHAAAKTIGNLGETADVAKLTGLVVSKKDSGDRDSLASALATVALREKDVATRAASIIAALAAADDEAKAQLLDVLSALGGKPAYEAVRGCLASTVPGVKKAAVKALAEWPDAAPLNDLLAVAKGDANDINRILALRGYIRELALANMKADKRAQLYRDAMGMAQRTEEKRAVLAGLAQVQDVSAYKLIATYFTDETVKAEAFLATLHVADVLAKKKGRETKAALEVVIKEATDKNLKKRAQDAFNKIK